MSHFWFFPLAFKSYPPWFTEWFFSGSFLACSRNSGLLGCFLVSLLGRFPNWWNVVQHAARHTRPLTWLFCVPRMSPSRCVLCRILEFLISNTLKVWSFIIGLGVDFGFCFWEKGVKGRGGCRRGWKFSHCKDFYEKNARICWLSL